MRPFDDADGGAVHQEAGNGGSPDDLVDDAVGTVCAVAETVAIKVKRAVVAPVVAASAFAPVKKTCADVFNLAFVVDEGVVGKGGAFDGGGEVDADFAVFKMVGDNFVVVSVVGENAFAGFVDDVVVDFGIVDVVEHDALVAAANGDVAVYFEAVGEHQDVAHVVADGNVVADFAVVGVHVVDGETQVAEAVVFVGVVFAGVGENAVAAFGNVVADNLRAGGVPDGDGVTAFVDAQGGVADDFVLAHHGFGRTVDIHADGVIEDVVVFNQGAGGGFFEVDAGVHGRQAHAGTGDGEVAQGNVGGDDGYGAAGAVAFDFSGAVGRTFDGDGFVDKQFGFVSAGGELERIACLRARDDFGEVVGRRNVDGGCKGRLNHAAEHKCQDSASPCFELGCVHGVPLIRAVCVGAVMPACEGRVFVL